MTEGKEAGEAAVDPICSNTVQKMPFINIIIVSVTIVINNLLNPVVLNV